MHDYQKQLRDAIVVYPDWPKPGIQFQDLSLVYSDASLFHLLSYRLAAPFYKDVDAVLAPEARGFVVGTSVARQLSTPLILARKPGKLPGELLTAPYSLEYGEASLSIQKDSIPKGARVLIVDDVLATGGTIKALQSLVEESGGTVAGTAVLVILKALRGYIDFPKVVGILKV